MGDSMVVANWGNGSWPIHDAKYERIYKRIWHLFDTLLWGTLGIFPLADASDFTMHIYREQNTLADALANKARDYGTRWHFADTFDDNLIPTIYCQVDGSWREGHAGCGAILFAPSNPSDVRADDPDAEVLAFL